MEVTQALSLGLWDTRGAGTDRIVSKECPNNEKRPVGSERTEYLSQITIQDSAVSILGLTEDAATAMVTLEGRNGFSRTDYQ